MANQTVYPYGTGGELPSSIGIINDLTTGGVNKALSAEMGKTLNGNLTQLGQEVEDISEEGFIFDVRNTIHITQGVQNASTTSIASGLDIPSGAVLKFRLTGASVLGEIYIVKNGWGTVYKGAYTEGEILTVKTTANITSLGMSVSADKAIGTGDVFVEVSTDYEESFRAKFDALVGDVSTIDLAQKIDAGEVSFEQGAFYLSGAPGGEVASATSIRCKGVWNTPFTLKVPDGFIIKRVFYYNSWVSNTSFSFGEFVVVDNQIYESKSNYPVARFTIEKVGGGNITPEDLYDALPLVSPKMDALNEKVDNLAENGFTYNDVKTIHVTQGEVIASRVNLLQNVNFPVGTTFKIMLTGTSVLSEVWILDNTWGMIYKGAYTDGDIITAVLERPLTSMGLYVDTGKAIGTGDVIVSMATDYDESLGGRISALENQSYDVNIITCKRTGVSGTDADFCGLNAIGDALASITDASEKKRYRIIVEGHYCFTNPMMESDGGDFKYVEGNEPTAIIPKEYVEITGTGKDSAVVEVNFDAGLSETDFPYSTALGRRLTFDDYQPVYFRQSGVIKDMTIIGKNCRYTIHIETDNAHNNSAIELYRCAIIAKDSTKGYNSCMTMGEIPGMALSCESCDFVAENQNGTLIGGHTPLAFVSTTNCSLKFKDCHFLSSGRIGISAWRYNRRDSHIFEGCIFRKSSWVKIDSPGSVKRPIGNMVIPRFNSSPLFTSVRPMTACGLRVTATTGASSSVRFVETCSAFAIVGDASEDTLVKLPYSAFKSFGYEYKDDTNGSHAYACGWVNVDPTTGNSLGSILGDCSSSPKTLSIVINGTQYDVVFNTDLTSATNDAIIASINSVIGSVATCDTFVVESQEYPDYDGVEYYIASSDNSVIQRGVGVVKTADKQIRRATASDGYIDGIAIDTIYKGQEGRIARKGVFASAADGNGYYYMSIYPVLSVGFGTKIGIDPNNPGQFIVSNSPVLHGIGNGMVELTPN